MTKYPPFSSTKVDKRDTAEATTQTKTDDATEITSLRKRCDRLEKKVREGKDLKVFSCSFVPH